MESATVSRRARVALAMGRRDDDEREDGEADGAPETAFPEGIDAKTTEAGGEVSMSLEETNRVREKLGLKPLRVGESDRAKRQREAEEAAHAARRDAEKSKETAEIAARIAAAKERRQMDARNRATAQLGEADDAEDDLSAWVSKSRDIELKEKLEAKRKAEELARKLAEQDDDFEDSESDDDGETRPKKSLGDMYTSEALAGLRVRHGADEVAEGETVVLTLKDSSILDETRTGVNDEGDELENVLLAEEKRRKRARAEATKRPANPFAEEDENDKTLLGKYDEKKEEDIITLNDAGAVSAAEEARKAEIRRRLAASLGGAPAGAEEQSAATEKKTLAEFLTPAEVEAREAAAAAAKFNRPKKKRRKKLREKKLDVDELEGDALVPAASELGSRRRREEEGSAADAAAATDRWRRDAHFAAALTKAKRRTDERILAEMAGEEEEENLEEEDDELERALARSRTAAAAAEKKIGGVDAVVAAVAERRLRTRPSRVAWTVRPSRGAWCSATRRSSCRASTEARGRMVTRRETRWTPRRTRICPPPASAAARFGRRRRLGRRDASSPLRPRRRPASRAGRAREPGRDRRGEHGVQGPRRDAGASEGYRQTSRDGDVGRAHERQEASRPAARARGGGASVGRARGQEVRLQPGQVRRVRT